MSLPPHYYYINDVRVNSMCITLEIKNVKNIKHTKIELPMKKGIYAFVGENGCGKSTLMLILSFMVKNSSARMLDNKDISNDSIIHIKTKKGEDTWCYSNNKLSRRKPLKGTDGQSNKLNSTHMEGFYEGSIFYGCRFDDYNMIDKFMQKSNYMDALVNADKFVSEKLGYILHNNKEYYKGLQKVANRKTAQVNGFKRIPYFLKCDGGVISQFRMSSGESMLISLIDFINNLVEKNKKSDDLLILIDEVELALHPSAINRLILFLEELVNDKNKNLIIYFSTHSSEVIHRIGPDNLFLLENNNGELICTNPCYPNYAVRNLYIHNGYDFLLLVEDELTKAVVDKVIKEDNLAESKLCCVLPAGGWDQILKLRNDIVMYNALGNCKQILCIFDGDVKDIVQNKEDYKNTPKCFIPVPSIEKYLKKKCIDKVDEKFIKYIGDKYFNQRSLKDIISDYKNDGGEDKDGKKFYKSLIGELSRIGKTKEVFVRDFCDDIFKFEDVSNFRESLRKLLKKW